MLWEEGRKGGAGEGKKGLGRALPLPPPRVSQFGLFLSGLTVTSFLSDTLANGAFRVFLTNVVQDRQPCSPTRRSSSSSSYRE